MEATALWKLNNPEKVKAMNRSWYLRNRDKAIANSNRYRNDNKERVEEVRKAYFKKNYQKILASTRQKRRANWQKYWAIGTIQSHKLRKCEVLITVSWLERLAHLTKTCFLCGRKLAWHGKKNNTPLDTSPSLDRKSNTLTLTKRNVQIICHRCNVTKGARTMAQFIRYCRKITSIKWN